MVRENSVKMCSCLWYDTVGSAIDTRQMDTNGDFKKGWKHTRADTVKESEKVRECYADLKLATWCLWFPLHHLPISCLVISFSYLLSPPFP